MCKWDGISAREKEYPLFLLPGGTFSDLPSQEGKGPIRARVTWEDAGRRQDLQGPLKDGKELVGRGRILPVCRAV